MRAISKVLGLSLLLCSFVPAVAPALLTEGDAVFEKDWGDVLQWRSVGPANMAGRIVAMAVATDDPSTYWVGTASGGLLKTTNAGNTYEHQFDHEGVVSVGDVAVAPSNSEIVWVGTGEANPRNSVSYGNGVYRSTDGGKSWKHMGLEQTFQIGRILIHPSDPNVVWVGALGRLYGSNEERGVYKTTDGGKSWEKVLYVDERTGVIDMDMHPTDPDTLLVATYERQRDLYDSNDPAKKWGPGSGIHKTSDGGKSWKRVSEGLPAAQLGRIGIDWYRKDPNVVFAVVETERIARLPDDAAYLGVSSEDADVGARVTRVDEGSPAETAGLKKDDILLNFDGATVLGRDALSRKLRDYKSGDKVALDYVRERQLMRAEIELGSQPDEESSRAPFSSGLGGQRENVHGEQGRGALETGGVFKSTDGGESWARINSLNPRPMYFSQIRVDPSDEKYIYVLGISLYRSEDGGATFTPDGHGDDVHVDHHALWVDPRDGRHIMLGNDGGLYVSHDRMKHWDHHNHVAIGQFYHVAVDSRRDYKMYGGLQDNGSWGGPSRPPYGGGPINTDWVRIGGGDGFVCAVDPTNPDLVYYESQNGGLGRVDLVTGEGGFMRPAALEGVRYRFNWKTPFQLSNHNSRMFYSAGNYVFRSFDRGNAMEAISPDITRTKDGSATALAESRHSVSTLFVGTDDGALWRTTDFGRSWTDLFDLEAPAKTLEAERAEWQRAEDERKAREREEKKAAKDKEKAEKKAEAAAEKAPEPPKDPLVGEWKGKLSGSGIPSEGAEFVLSIRREEGRGVVLSFTSEKLKAEGQNATFDAESGNLTVELGSEAGPVQLTAKVEGERMGGKLSVAGGLFELAFEASREGKQAADLPAPEARDEFPATSPGAAQESGSAPAAQAKDVVAGDWEAEIVDEEGGGDRPGFRLLLRRAEDGSLVGSTSSERGEGTIESASFDADSGALRLRLRSERGTFEIEAKVEGERMKGTLTVGGGAFSMDFEAKRRQAEPAAPAPAAEAPPQEAAQPAAEPAASTSEPAAAEPAAEGQPKKEPRKDSLAALLPKAMCVSSIEPSHHKAGRVYVTFDGHRSDDDQPWVFVSEDNGESWKSLRANLPVGSARALREDRANQDLLYLGTEFGAYVSLDRGESWVRLAGKFPTVAVHDFAQHESLSEVVLATHGRSLWILDVAPLRQWTSDVREQSSWLFEPSSVSRPTRGMERGNAGTRAFQGDAPAREAALYYLLRKKPKELKLGIYDLSGELLRELEVSKDAGLHYVAWDLRRAPREAAQGGPESEGPRRFRGGRALAAGRYKVVLEVDGQKQEREIVIEDDGQTPGPRGVEEEDG